MNVMNDADRDRRRVHAPELGEVVELVEGTVAEILELREVNRAAKEGESGEEDGRDRGSDLVWQVMALSLRVDGRRFTVDELMHLGARKFHRLVALSTQAMEFNGFYAVADDEDESPKD